MKYTIEENKFYEVLPIKKVVLFPGVMIMDDPPAVILYTFSGVLIFQT